MNKFPPQISRMLEKAWESQISGHIQDAVEIYKNILSAEKNPAAWLGLGQCHLELKQTAEALNAFKKAAELLPHSGAIRHMVDMLSGDRIPDRAPDDYLLWVFNGHAANFDAHLKALDYRGPGMIADLVLEIWEKRPSRKILDLGCGTGLNADNFKQYSSRLDGVDLAPEMLRQCVFRGQYDNLYQAEIHALLGKTPIIYDTLLASDVFIYVGRLDEIFRLANNSLSEFGDILFTIELGDSADVQLMPTGRFRHSDEYIRRLAEGSGFYTAKSVVDTIRIENGHPEIGCAYRFVKK